jgi:molybdopterin molybdotransferase
MGDVARERVASGATLRIPTGGVVPNGCDAVVPIEHVTRAGDRIVVAARIAPGDNVNERAADMRAGEIVLAPGTRLRAPQIGVLATLGITAVPVYRRPLLAVLSSGDELIAPDRSPQPGQIRDSNRYAIAASLRAMGADVLHLPIVRDEAAAFDAALRDALDRADGVVLTGGSSVGERDRTPEAVAALGPPGVVVHGLKLRPGKPTLLGAAGAKPILGLPGNPTSALMMLEAVAAPLIAAMVGSAPPPASIEATLDAPLSGREGWTWFIPIALRDEPGAPMAHPLGLRSFSVSLTARADGYVILEAGRWFYEAGERVTIHRFLGG